MVPLKIGIGLRSKSVNLLVKSEDINTVRRRSLLEIELGLAMAWHLGAHHLP